MKVLFDTNVVLDLLLARKPYADNAAQLFVLVDKGKIQGIVCATTVTTIHYIAAKKVGDRRSRKLIGELMELFDVAPVGKKALLDAMELHFPDYEDAVLHEAARTSGADAIVTRNGKDFARASIPIFDPTGLLSVVRASEDST